MKGHAFTQIRFVTVASLALVAAVLVLTLRVRPIAAGPTSTLTLTAVAPGVWTQETVRALDVWRRDFVAARPVLREGETVRLRLQSTDVVHSFSAPELGIDPVEVAPGDIVTLTVTPERAGAFAYYCTVACGERHFAMRGIVEVRGPGEAPVTGPRPTAGGDYWRTPFAADDAPLTERGAALFRRSGCVTCHGAGGHGRVPNPNSMNAEVPELATLARRTFLFAPAEVHAFLGLLGESTPLEEIEGAPGISLFAAVRSQYLATRNLVAEGRRSTKLDPEGPQPALDMPAWGARLDRSEIDAILAYLLDSEVLTENDLADPKGDTR